MAPRDALMTGRGAPLAGLVLLAVALAGCSEPAARDNILRRPAELTGFATTVGEPKDFVREKRLAHEDYIPVGVTPPDHAIKPKSPADLARYQKALDESRARTEAAASRPAPRMKPIQGPRKLPPIPGSRIDPAAGTEAGSGAATTRVQNP